MQKHFDEKIDEINNENLLNFGEDAEKIDELPKDDFKTLVRHRPITLLRHQPTTPRCRHPTIPLPHYPTAPPPHRPTTTPP